MPDAVEGGNASGASRARVVSRAVPRTPEQGHLRAHPETRGQKKLIDTFDAKFWLDAGDGNIYELVPVGHFGDAVVFAETGLSTCDDGVIDDE